MIEEANDIPSAEMVENNMRAAIADDILCTYGAEATVLDYYAISKTIDEEGRERLSVTSSGYRLTEAEILGWLNWALILQQERVRADLGMS